jgi:hypothetical protein
MEWLKNLISGTNKNDHASFSSRLGSAVIFDLAPLGKKNPLLLKDAARYVLNGEPAEVLLKLRSKRNYGEALGLFCCRKNYSSNNKTRAIFKRVDPEKAVCYLRLLRVYESAAASSNSWVVPVTGVSRWLDIFIQEATGLQQYTWRQSLIFDSTITATFVEKMLEAAEEPTDMMVRAAFLLEPSNYSATSIIETITSLTGFYATFSRHAKVILEALNHSEHCQRVQALNILFHDSVDLTPFREKIAALACSPAKTVREAARKFIIRKPLIFNDCILQILQKRDNQERLYAVTLYAQVNPENAPKVLEERLPKETAPKVKAAIEKALVEFTGQVNAGYIPQNELSEELGITIPPVVLI